jgi:2-hydroxycyclohexanecarboxyl-CoA dehydrogenase
MDASSLKDRVVIVTGGAKGIGAGIVAALHGRGARVTIFDRDPVTPPPGVRLRQVDVGDYAAVRSAVEATAAEAGTPFLLVNNAGWDRVQPFLDNDPELWPVLVRVNLLGVFNTIHATLPLMRDGGGGRIINIASDAGRVGSSGEAAYSACKGGVIAFTKSMAREAARHRVLVNCVCPGPADTPLMAEMRSEPEVDRLMEAIVRATPLRKFATPEDVAAAVLYFAEEPGHVTGQVLSVSGGLTMV